MECQQLQFMCRMNRKYKSFMELSTIPNESMKKITIQPGSVGDVRPAQMPKGLKNPLWWGVGDRLRQIGIDENLTQRQISEASGVAAPSISQLELKRTFPGIDTVERLATALGISPSWLAYGEQGTRRFRQRYPRPVVPHDPPQVSLAARELAGHFRRLPERLKAARTARELSFQQLAAAVEEKALELHAVETKEEAKLTRQALHLLESGQRVPSVSTCWLLALGLDVSPGWLAYGEGEGLDDAVSTSS